MNTIWNIYTSTIVLSIATLIAVLTLYFANKKFK